HSNQSFCCAAQRQSPGENQKPPKISKKRRENHAPLPLPSSKIPPLLLLQTLGFCFSAPGPVPSLSAAPSQSAAARRRRRSSLDPAEAGIRTGVDWSCIIFVVPVTKHLNPEQLSQHFLHSHEMSLLSRFFYKRPPDGLLEFIDRIYVFDSCFSTEVLPQGMYPVYLNEILTELHEEHVESSFLAINFRDGDKRSQFADILREYNIPVIDYPRHFEGCPVLPLSLIQHFLRVCEHWLSSGNNKNIVLLHCERGTWPLLAFLLSCLLIYKKLHGAEHKTLDIIYREAPKGFLQLFSALNPMPSQLRYMQYVARRNISPEWPPMERALSLDCLILRAIPSFDSDNGCRPLVRIFGRNLLGKNASMANMIFSMPKKKSLRHYRQEDCDVIKIDIQSLMKMLGIGFQLAG
ncbi:unnamed protein product, partial [Urochloa humidicola]